MTSGRCGKNLTWTLDDDGTLTISGRGKMYDYVWYYGSDIVSAPWGTFSRELIRKVVLEVGVTTIGRGAFVACKSLTSVIISNSVMTIGRCAFSFCENLTSVIIPASVTTVGAYAFSDCPSLTSIKIPESVTAIGSHAFNWCTGLTSVTIPASVIAIGGWVFNYCKFLKKIYYKRGTKIDLESLTLGNNAKLIPYDELPPAQVKPSAQVKLPTQEPAPPVEEPPPAQAKSHAQIEPPAQAKSPAQAEPPAETNCTVYRNTKINRAENIAPPNTKSLSRVDENIAEIRRAAELAAMNIVMTIERDLGFSPEDVSSQNLGYDIKSTSRDGKTSRLIEVKGRHIDAETVTVSRNEIDAALNNPDDFILAIVRLDGGKNETIYIRKPFELPPDRAALSVNFSIQKLVEVSNVPS